MTDQKRRRQNIETPAPPNPFDPDVIAANELAVVKAFCRSPRAQVLAVLERLPPEDFTDPFCRWAAGSIQEHLTARQALTPATLAAAAKDAAASRVNGARPPAAAMKITQWHSVFGDNPDAADGGLFVSLTELDGAIDSLSDAAVRRRHDAAIRGLHEVVGSADPTEYAMRVADLMAALADDPAAAAAPAGTDVERLAAQYLREAQARQAAREQLAVAEFARPDPPRTLTDIRANPKHEPGWRVAGLVQLRAFLTIVAARKVGKTSLIGSLLLAVLDGTGPALGRVEWEVTASTPGKVLILSYEMGEEWQDWLDSAGVTTDYGDRVLLWDLLNVANPLASAAGRAEFTGYLAGVDLVIIDTFAQAYFAGLAPGGGVNEDVNAWLNMVRGIVGPDRSLWLSVHAGWDGSRSRGASAIEDQPTSIITIEQATDGTRFVSTRGRRVEETRRVPLRQDPQTLRVTVNDQGPAWSVANAKDTGSDDNAKHAATLDRKRAQAVTAKESDQWAALRFLAGMDAPAGRRLVTAGTPLSDGAASTALEALGLRGCAEQLPKRAGWQITPAGLGAVDAGSLPPIRGV